MIDPAFSVARWNASYRVLAARPLDVGAEILRLEGVLVSAPSRWTVQVGAHQHLDLPVGIGLEEQLDRYPWSFLNHSCQANARVRGRLLVALRDLREGEPVTFDYNSNEARLAAPFECDCGAVACLGTVRGHEFLTHDQRRRVAPFAAPWLRGSARRASARPT